MAYVNKPRPYKKEHQQSKARGEHKARMFRQTARREFDKKHTGKATTRSPKRAGLDISHNKALAHGGKNSDGYRLEEPGTNRARNRHKTTRKG